MRFRPSAAASRAADKPAGPPPMIAKSNVSVRTLKFPHGRRLEQPVSGDCANGGKTIEALTRSHHCPRASLKATEIAGRHGARECSFDLIAGDVLTEAYEVSAPRSLV